MPKRVMRTVRRADGDPQCPCAGLCALRGLALRGGIRGGPGRSAGAWQLAALAACLHAVAVDLLHRLDVLWRGRVRGAVGSRIRYDLSRPDAGDDRLVVDAAASGPGR